MDANITISASGSMRLQDDLFAATSHAQMSCGQRAQMSCGQPGDELNPSANLTAATLEPRKSRILIVDDDHAVRETMAELMELAGLLPLQAGDAAEAMMILRQDPDIDAMVTDLTMPGADGITLIRLARELKPQLPAILLTGYAEQVASITTSSGGNFPVLSKPVKSDSLLVQIEVLLAQR